VAYNLGVNRRRQALSEEQLLFLREVRQRHPHRTSDGGALLCEILTSTSLSDQSQAAFIYWLMGFRRGLKDLTAFAEQMIPRIHECGKEKYLFAYLMDAIGKMDTPASHAVVVQFVNGPTPRIRSCALDAMTWEDKQFDLNLVMPFVSMDLDQAEILSALWVLDWKRYGRKHREARERLEVFLTSPDPHVRGYAVRVLGQHKANMDLVKSLKDDPDLYVRQEVDEMVSR
jgi:hypothetical protein